MSTIQPTQDCQACLDQGLDQCDKSEEPAHSDGSLSHSSSSEGEEEPSPSKSNLKRRHSVAGFDPVEDKTTKKAAKFNEQEEEEEDKTGEENKTDIDAALGNKLKGLKLVRWEDFRDAQQGTHWYYSKTDRLSGQRKLVYAIKSQGPPLSLQDFDFSVEVRPYKSFNGISGWTVRDINQAGNVEGQPNFRFYKRTVFDTATRLTAAVPVKKNKTKNAKPSKPVKRATVKKSRKGNEFMLSSCT